MNSQIGLASHAADAWKMAIAGWNSRININEEHLRHKETLLTQTSAGDFLEAEMEALRAENGMLRALVHAGQDKIAALSE